MIAYVGGKIFLIFLSAAVQFSTESPVALKASNSDIQHALDA
jgi:hypothetical protein